MVSKCYECVHNYVCKFFEKQKKEGKILVECSEFLKKKDDK